MNDLEQQCKIRLVRCVDDVGYNVELDRHAAEEHLHYILGYWMREITSRVVSQVMVYGMLGGAVGVIENGFGFPNCRHMAIKMPATIGIMNSR